ncbi:MAG: hypothetical protein ACE5I3_14995, partial [Phycisphaerae bacterium]
MEQTDILLIGVDGGATEAKAHAVACDDLEKPRSFELRSESASRTYPRVADFAPLPLSEQLAQRDADNIQLSAKEIEQGQVWVEAAAAAIIDVAPQCSARRVLVGTGMPGLKTPDGRGINVINNGPRIPHYLDALEQNLAAAGLELVSPIAALGSDADYCGLGEEYAAEGLFRDVENAYYLGCGTGIADAMKLHGRLVSFNQAKSWIMKAWQIPSALGATFEKLVSAESLNRVYADLTCGAPNVAAGPRTGRGTQAHATKPRGREATERDVAADVSSADGRRDAGRDPAVAAAAGPPRAVAGLDTPARV